MNTDMDALIMNNFLLIKEAQAFDRKEECRPFPRKRTAVNSRETLELQKECRRLFDRYLRHMDRLDTAHGGHSASSWKECTEGHHWDVMRKEDVLSADVVLRTWGVFSESQKRQLRPLVEEVVLLSNLRKDFSADVGEAPNDAIYAMF
jgi:hypothetical protein